jgi:long-subunit acyl-CoA synthetase (AMP-forming)
VNNKAETEKAVEADGFFNAGDLAGFVSIKGRSISKMSDC